MDTNSLSMKNPTHMSYIYETAELNTAASEIPSQWC